MTEYTFTSQDIGSGKGRVAVIPLPEGRTLHIYDRDMGAEIERLRKALDEALGYVVFWASFVPRRYQNEHDINGDLARLRAALEDASKP